MRATHKTRLLEYLRNHDTISQLEATGILHNIRLSATVFELRKDGYNIATIGTKGINAYGEPTNFGRYRLIENEVNNNQ